MHNSIKQRVSDPRNIRTSDGLSRQGRQVQQGTSPSHPTKRSAFNAGMETDNSGSTKKPRIQEQENQLYSSSSTSSSLSPENPSRIPEPTNYEKIVSLIVQAKEASWSHDYNEALRTYEQVLEFREIECSKNTILSQMGDLLFKQANYLDAELKYKEVLKTSKDLLPEIKCQISKSLGHAQLMQGNYEEASDAFNKCLRMLDISDSTRSHLLMDLGLTYYTQKQYKKTIEILEEILGIPEISNDIEEAMYTYLGISCYKEKSFNKATQYFENALKINDISNETKSRLFTYLGKCYFKQGNYNEALDAFYEALYTPAISAELQACINLALSKTYSAQDNPKAVIYDIFAFYYSHSLPDNNNNKQKASLGFYKNGTHNNIFKKLNRLLKTEDNPITQNEIWEANGALTQLRSSFQ